MAEHLPSDLLRTLLQAMPECIYCKDAEGRFTLVNQALADFYGVKDPRAVLGKTDFDFYSSEAAGEYRRDELEVMRTGRTLYNKEEICVGPLREPRQYSTTKAPIRDEAGNVVGIAGISRDITSSRKARVALRESERRFRLVYESPMIGIHFWDADGNVREANDAYLHMVGYTREDLAANAVRWRDMTPAEYHDRDDRALEQMRNTGACVPFEKEYVRKDGTRLPILLGAALLPDSEHEGVAFALDLTELKRTERELNAQRMEHEIILDSVPAMIWYKDRENRIIRANRAAAISAGMTKEMIEGRSTHDLYPAEAAAYHADDLEVINSGRPKMGIVERLALSNGEMRWIRTDKIPYRDERGEIIGVIVFATDITDLKQTEAALRGEQELMKIVMDNMPDAIYLKDRASRFLRTNPAHAAIMGIRTPEEAIGKTDESFFRPEDAAVFLADEQNVMSSGQALVNRVEHHGGAGGAMRWWSTTKVPIRNSQDEITGIAGITRDISKLMQAEEEIRQLNERLERRVAERTAELEKANEQLRAEAVERRQAEYQVLLYQQRLRSLASELSLAEERERRRIAVDLHDQVGQTLALLQIKMQAAREAAGNNGVAKALDECVELIRQPIQDMRSLVFNLSPPVLYDLGFEAAVAWLVDQHQGRLGLAITLNDDHQPKPLDEAVAVLLFRAIRELLTNVIKHSRARAVRIWMQRERREIIIGVEDDGVGFDTASASTRSDGSTGFGLFSIREQLDRLGGRMTMDSRRGGGTRTRLAVPLRQGPEVNAGGKE